MSVGPSGKTAAATPSDDRSLPALLARLRELRDDMSGDLSVEDVERELKRIETAKWASSAKAQARKNLRERIIYALTDVGDESAAVGSNPPSAASTA